VLLLLGVDAADGFPMTEEIDSFQGFDGEISVAKEFVQVEVGAETDAIKERRNDFFANPHKTVVALEMIEKDEVTARTANAFHFLDHCDRIWDGGNEVGSEHSIEAVVRELEFGGVHFHETHIFQIEIFDTFFGVIEHFLGEIDPGDIDIFREQRQRKAGADADLEQFGSWENIEQSRRHFASALEDFPENQVIDSSIRVVDSFDIWDGHYLFLN
jgi:hypothetical protein